MKTISRRGMYEAIAAMLMAAATQYPETLREWVIDRSGAKKYIQHPLAEFHFGTLTIRCTPSAPRIRAVAEKYRRGVWLLKAAPVARMPSLRRPPDADAILRKLEQAA